MNLSVELRVEKKEKNFNHRDGHETTAALETDRHTKQETQTHTGTKETRGK